MKRIWKSFKFIFIILLILFAGLVFVAVIKPIYEKEVVAKRITVEVDKSGERVTSKNKSKKVNENKKKKEEVKENNTETKETLKYKSFILDDRILLYEGDVRSPHMEMFVDTLVEDSTSETFSKPEIEFINIDGIGNKIINYEENEEDYKSTIEVLKNNINSELVYKVEFKYNTIKTLVNKIIISK